MTNERPTTGARPGALVNEKGGGRTMLVRRLSTGPEGRFVHCEFWDETNELCVATFRDEDLVVIVEAQP